MRQRYSPALDDDQEHRLVYQVDGNRVYFLAARHHY